MTTQPIIYLATGSKDSTSTLILALVRTNVRGVAQLRVYPGSGSCTTEDTSMQTNSCIEAQDSTYIANLYQLMQAYKTSTTTSNNACIRTYSCSVEDCNTLTCTPQSNYTTELTNVYFNPSSGLTPPTVADLTLTPGNGKIVASWSLFNNPTAWTFAIRLLQGTTRLADGYVDSTSVTIGNLNNGTEYTFRIWVRSYDGYLSAMTERKAIPSIPPPACTTPSCTFSIN